ncbi:NAD(P)-binding protein [Dendrothele bispora CBS 962.96]|uniref:NAD(P)-binding protein n=1 Tax=Dendrothele bispora (strain CBS 962.96) TaxID=1314807 RepID=A0A4S8MLS8_DENBC|nr:NAD(P)-binding protein [Dendrothele bispora CBS 962.96]
MKIAVTGSSGSVGSPLVALALARGHSVLGLDITPSKTPVHHPDFTFVSLDLRSYEDVVNVLRGCDAVVNLAGLPNPTDYVAATHNTNVVISWNVLRAAAELGIDRVAQASSVNIITLVYSQRPRFEYFPIDEMHPCLPDEPYGLSKLICEMQADTIVRRYPSMRVASLRLHWSLPDPTLARKLDSSKAKNDLWGYVQEDSAADAFLRALTDDSDKWSGHEAFFIASPTTACETESKILKEQFWPDVPLKSGFELSGNISFFDCSKANGLLGWVHADSLTT